jgi:hypothetical protein
MKSIPAGLRTILSAFSFIFSVFIGCKKEPPHSNPAKGSLQNQYGECLPGNLHGIWYNGLPANTDTNFVDINVNVTSPGSYNITTDKQNGVTFAASGIFADTGLKVVRLKATGTFISPGTFTFHDTFDSSTCQFAVDVQDSAGLSLADNTFQFTAQGHVYRGPCELAVYNIPQSPGVVDAEFNGRVGSATGDTVLQMSFGGNNVYNGVFDTIPYPAFMIFYNSKTGKRIYMANADSIPRTSFNIHVRSQTSSLIATFNGTVLDSAGNMISITDAKFKVY